MCQCHQIGLFEDVEDRNPELTGRLHANFLTAVLVKPESQLLQAHGEGQEASLKVFGTRVCISDADAGIDLGLVNVQSTAILTENFEHGVPPARDYRVGRDWLSGEIESTSEEISLRAKVLSHSLMPLRTADSI